MTMTRGTHSLRIIASAAIALAIVAGPLVVAGQFGGGVPSSDFNTGGGANNTFNTGGGGTGCGASCTVKNPLNAPDFATLMNKILQGVLIIAVPIIVLFIVYSGFLFVTARGDTTKLQQARTNFLWVVVGAVVLVGASAIAAIIANTLKAFGVGS